jgi:hypothetical protein
MNGFNDESFQTFREFTPIPHRIFKRMEDEKILPNSSDEPSFTMMLKQTSPLEEIKSSD